MLLICQGVKWRYASSNIRFLQHKLLFLLADFGERPLEKLVLAREAVFERSGRCPAGDVAQRYFGGRTDGLRRGSEAVLVATT